MHLITNIARILFTGAVIDRTFRADFNTGAAFDTVVDVNRHSFTVFQFVDLPWTRVHAVAMPFAFVVIHFNCNHIALPCFYSHFGCLLSLLSRNRNLGSSPI